MSTFRTVFCDVADILRSLTGPNTFDVRPTQLTIRTRTYIGGRRSSQGAHIDTDLVIPAIYKVRQIKTNEVAQSGGLFEMGDVVVGPITPKGDTLGWTEAQLQPKSTSDGVDYIYILTGNAGHAGEYSRVHFESTRPFSYFLFLRRRNTTP